MFTQVTQLFSSIIQRKTADLLILSFALISDNKYLNTENILRLTQTEPWLTIMGKSSSFCEKAIT